MSLETIVGLLLEYKYIVMVPLIPFMQPVVGVAAGVLGRLHLIDIPLAYIILVSVALAGDAMWYWVGRTYGERFVARYGRFVGVSSSHVRLAKELFLRHHPAILIIAKIINGLGLAIAVLFTAGMSRVPFWRYLFFNAIGESIWSGMIIAAGYFFGDLYAQIHDEFGRSSLVMLGLVLLVALYCAMRVMQKRFEKYVEENEQEGGK